jgi:hypothetical protein
MLTPDINNFIQSLDFHATHFCKQDLAPPSKVHHAYKLLDKLNTNLTTANVEAKTCS